MSLALGAIGISTITTLLDPVIDFVVVHLSILVTPTSAHHVAHTTAQIFAFIFISALHIVGGELAPKVYAFHRPVKLSLAVARTINFLYRVLYSSIWLLNHAANGLLRLFGQRDPTGPRGGHFSISEEELRIILSASESEGVLAPEETAMIRGVFDLEEHRVEEIMVPRTRIVPIPHQARLLLPARRIHDTGRVHIQSSASTSQTGGEGRTSGMQVRRRGYGWTPHHPGKLRAAT